MRTLMLIAEAATIHPDQTFSLLKGGINRFTVPASAACAIRCVVLTRMVAEPTERNVRHMFELHCITEDGKRVSKMSGNFSFGAEQKIHNLLVETVLNLPGPGNYAFALTINNEERERWPFEVLQAKGEQKGGQP